MSEPKHTPGQPDGLRGDLYALSHFSEPDAAAILKSAADRIGALERVNAELLAALEQIAGYPHADHAGLPIKRCRTIARAAIARAKGE